MSAPRRFGSPNHSLRPETKNLRETLDERDEEIRQLKAVLGQQKVFPKGLRLRRMERRLLGFILAKSPYLAATESILNVVWSDRDVARVSVAVAISRIRTALKPHGVEIITWRNDGYSMPMESAAKLRALMGTGT